MEIFTCKLKVLGRCTFDGESIPTGAFNEAGSYLRCRQTDTPIPAEIRCSEAVVVSNNVPAYLTGDLPIS